MCKNGTRRLIWEDATKMNSFPIFLDANVGLSESQSAIYLDLHIDAITKANEYQIFSSMRLENYSHVFDLIDSHVGVNAVDEWGQTPLMVAVQTNRMDIVAALLNTRLPKVDVNTAKPSGYTALFYAVEKGSVSMVSALLRRGADPNAILLHDGSKGTTPLHFACLLEKTKQAELLLEYGARPDARNEHGQVPLQLLPYDAVRSTKLFFKKMFEVNIQL
jgi:ankyrin repeat protein